MSAASTDLAWNNWSPAGVEVLRQASVPAHGLRLSVVVPNYNTAAFVPDAITSILAQSMPELELIVVDDGSRDDSLERILACPDPRLTLVRQPNRGLAGARNTGIVYSRADLIGFCDSDDVWHPDKAARQLALMDGDAGIGLTFSHSMYLTEEGSPTGQLLVSRCGRPGVRDLIARNHIGNGSTPIVRRACFRRAGLFDEDLAAGCEDFEMWVRIACLSRLEIRLVPEVLTGYRIRWSSGSMTFDRFLEGHYLAVERLRSYVPGFTDRDARRSRAEHLRIASRKAFSAGETDLSRAYLLRALRACPSLALQDPRALGMVALHVASLPLPRSLRQRIYEAATRTLARAQARFVEASKESFAFPSAGPAVAHGGSVATR
jgi:glycosyltransferase involved in cell wall biosynthesis